MDEKVVKDSQGLAKELVNDTISRQEAIHAICRDGVRLERGGALMITISTAKQWAVDLLGELPSAQPEQRWIPCSERLPEDFQPFYATCRSNIDNRKNWVIEGYYTPLRGFNPPPLVAEGKAEIVAWMPKELPEPYKEDDK